MRVFRRLWWLIAVAVIASGCGGNDSSPAEDDPATPPPPPPVASPTAANEMTLHPLVWADAVDADSGEPTSPVESFTAESPAIIAVIEVDNIPAGTDFVATWTINGLDIPDAEMHVVADGDMPHAWVAFKFTRDDDHRYPTGELSVTITVSTGQLIEEKVDITFP